METTEIIVEVPVIGAGLALVLTPVLAAWIGSDSKDLLQSMNLKELLVVAVTVVYPLGLLWSRFADTVFQREDRVLREKFFLKRDDYHDALVLIHHASPTLGGRLYQVRSLYRIARASTLTILLGAIVFTPRISEVLKVGNGRLTTVAFAIVCAGAAVAMFRAWRHLRISYLDWALRAATLLSRSNIPAKVELA